MSVVPLWCSPVVYLAGGESLLQVFDEGGQYLSEFACCGTGVLTEAQEVPDRGGVLNAVGGQREPSGITFWSQPFFHA